MMSWRVLAVTGVTVCLAAVSTAVETTSVKPLGAYPFGLPGDSATPGAAPKALLWCQGTNLVGVVVPDEKSSDCGSPKRQAPHAYLLKDGQCEADGSAVSFGFMVARKAWVFESSGPKRQERTEWLLHHFEGTLKDGHLKGALVQVDIAHPGHPFQKKAVEVEALPGDQPPFADDVTWKGHITQTFCLPPGTTP
jgi:hypothetical protein